MSNQAVVTLNKVSFSYNNSLVLKDVTLSINDREFIWIVGPNGGGKTTLIKIILGLLRPDSGSVKVFNSTPEAARQRIGYMPQHAHLDIQFPVTVIDIALMGRLGSSFKPSRYSTTDRQIAFESLEQVGLAELAKRPLKELSGGQQRRLLIARALSSKPDLLLLDEPTANLDRRAEQELYDLLRKQNQRQTIVLVSHDPAFVSDFVEHVVCVNQTAVVHPTAKAGAEFIDELYGRQVRLVRHDKHRDDQEGC